MSSQIGFNWLITSPNSDIKNGVHKLTSCLNIFVAFWITWKNATSLHHTTHLIRNKNPYNMFEYLSFLDLNSMDFIYLFYFEILQIGELAGIAVGSTVLLNVMFAGYYYLTQS